MLISDLLNIVIQIDFPSRKLASNAHDDYRYGANMVESPSKDTNFPELNL